jgi:hypothetical protein
MNAANAPWKKTFLSVAVFVLMLSEAVYLLAPLMASGWPLADRDGVTFIAREFIISRFLEAVIFWALMGFLILYGHDTRVVKSLRFLPYVAFGIFLSSALIIFHRSTVVFLNWNSNKSCFPSCNVNDQVCFLTSQLCFDIFGMALFVIFKLVPLALLLLYFAIPVHRAKKLRETAQ